MSSSAASSHKRFPARAGAARNAVAATVALASLTMLGSPNAMGVQWGADLAAGVLESDNIYRTETGEKSALIRTAQADFAALQSTRQLDLDAIGSVVYRQYGINGVSDDTLPTFDGLARWTPVADRFSWILSDNLGQFAVDPNDSLLQTDRETLNIVNTGPDLHLPMGIGWGINAGARYSRISYQRSPFDNDRIAGSVALEHDLESGSSWNIRVLDAHTNYTSVDSQFDVRTASAGYTAIGRRGEIDANVGYTQLAEQGDHQGGFFADIRLARQFSRRASVALDFVDRYADSSEIFSRQQDLDPVIQSTVSFIPSDVAARELAANLSLELAGRRSDASMGAVYYKNEFVAGGEAADRTGVGGYFAGNFRPSPTLALTARAEIRHEKPDAATYFQAGAGIVWNFTRKLGLVLGAARFEQTGSDNNYSEMRYSAAVQWTIRRIPGVPGVPEIGSPAVRRISISR